MLKEGLEIKDYTLKEFLGKGGFGDVWKARKSTDLFENEFEFAIKFFRPEYARGINIERIKKEIEIWKRVSGASNIISVLDADRFENYIYIVSEYANGGTLEEWINANGGKAASPEQAVQIIMEILNGLENMHSRNFIHRDLKPANILIKKMFFA